jgi:Cu2+-exporting ATPase
MTETQKHPGTNGTNDHQSMAHASMNDHGQPHTDPAHVHSEHDAMQHGEIKSSSPMNHGGHVGQAKHGESNGHAEHNATHTDHSGHEQMFRRKFWVSLFLSIPVILYSMGLQMMLGISLPAFPGSQWLAPFLA